MSVCAEFQGSKPNIGVNVKSKKNDEWDPLLGVRGPVCLLDIVLITLGMLRSLNNIFIGNFSRKDMKV